MKNLQALETERQALLNELRSEGKSLTNRDKNVLAKLKENERQIKLVKIQSKLNQVNSNQTRLRDLAKTAWECEEPAEDITTDSGYFHKTKVKKYPNLAALSYASATFEDGKMTRLTINGERFNMYSTKHEYDKPTVYTRPTTFEEFLQHNCIRLRDLTSDELSEIMKANDELSEKVKAFSEEISGEYKKLGVYSLMNLGLFSQDTERIYTYRINY